MSTTAATRFGSVIAQLRQANRLSANQASELTGTFSALAPAQQQALSEKLVDGSGQLSPALQKLLDPKSEFSMLAAYSALSLSMPTKTDVAADFRVLAQLQQRGDFAQLFAGAGVVDSRAAADRVAGAALKLADPTHPQPVRELEALIDSTRGLGRDPGRLRLLGEAVRQLSPEHRAVALAGAAERGEVLSYQAIAQHAGDLELGLPTFTRLVAKAMSDFTFSEGERQMVADAFSRLPEGDRAHALTQAAKHTAFDVHALDGVLKPGETLPRDAFAPYVRPQYVDTALEAKVASGSVEELGALFNRLSPADQKWALDEIAKVSPKLSGSFGRLAQKEARSHEPALWSRVLTAFSKLG